MFFSRFVSHLGSGLTSQSWYLFLEFGELLVFLLFELDGEPVVLVDEVLHLGLEVVAGLGLGLEFELVFEFEVVEFLLFLAEFFLEVDEAVVRGVVDRGLHELLVDRLRLVAAGRLRERLRAAGGRLVLRLRLAAGAGLRGARRVLVVAALEVELSLDLLLRREERLVLRLLHARLPVGRRVHVQVRLAVQHLLVRLQVPLLLLLLLRRRRPRLVVQRLLLLLLRRLLEVHLRCYCPDIFT